MAKMTARLIAVTAFEIGGTTIVIAGTFFAIWWFMRHALHLPNATAMFIIVPSAVLMAITAVTNYPVGWRRRHNSPAQFDQRLILGRALLLVSMIVGVLILGGITAYLAALALWNGAALAAVCGIVFALYVRRHLQSLLRKE